MSEPVRAALVGAGGYAGKHVIPLLQRAEGLVYVAVCDVDRAVARRAAGRLGAGIVETDLAAVLAREEVEMVDLQTPNFLHADQAVAALGAGKHVLVQKPMAVTLEEARRMVRAAEAAGRRLGVYLDDLNDPLLWDMRAMVRAGLVGTPTAFHIRYAYPGGLAMNADAWRRSAAATGGGSFTLLAIHNVAALRWVLDAHVVRAAAFQKTMLAPMEGDDSTAGALELDSGLVGTAASSYVAVNPPGLPGTVTEILGTEGALRHERDHKRLFVYSERGTFAGPIVRYERPGRVRRYGCPRRRIHRPSVHEQFAAAVRGGGRFVADGARGFEDLAVCLAMAEASETGRTVDVARLRGQV